MNSLMMADAWLSSVEKRLEILEQRVFGDIDKDAQFPKVILLNVKFYMWVKVWYGQTQYSRKR